ncbi:MAG: hypothetical protein CO029_04860 [Candidatus Magasanikbacteria bacterium CG_4_9_14_0_2_um_filter_41_10]|nr:MAG: hypothetical protein AUJ37_02325 [Candidatus Magasanikbacteria bacterium CG1_02_41_34]PJC53040.1 MAG: hypothetical protein CO029_04860 [Candidatus Magasanikbacteria bacterium CG_4_9_14_0_2_um_filter_41_10]
MSDNLNVLVKSVSVVIMGVVTAGIATAWWICYLNYFLPTNNFARGVALFVGEIVPGVFLCITLKMGKGLYYTIREYKDRRTGRLTYDEHLDVGKR